MNATELFHKDGKATGVFYCTSCRIVSRTQEQAEECCKPRKCSNCKCELPKETYYTGCSDCRVKREAAKEKERFERAEKVSAKEWGGWVYLEDVGDNNGYFDSVGELLAHFEEEGLELPDYCYVAEPKQWVQAEVYQITQSIEGDAPEDFDFRSLAGLKELKEALEKFNEANANELIWWPNYKKAVLLK